MRFWECAACENSASHYARKLAALKAELNSAFFCAGSAPRTYFIDMKELDALECHERWPETPIFSG